MAAAGRVAGEVAAVAAVETGTGIGIADGTKTVSNAGYVTLSLYGCVHL